MNRFKKLLSVFLVLAVMAFCIPMGVFAQSGSRPEPYFPDLDATSDSNSSSSASSDSPPPSSSSSSSSPSSSSSSPPPSSSRSYSSSSSRTVKQTGAGVASSASTAASETVSGLESEDMPGEVSSVPQSSEISLPSVASVSETDPLDSAVINKESSHRLNWIGIVSWACIALGIIVVLIVVFSNRRPPRGMGRKRYRRPKRSRKKRLLNDKYYRDLNRY